MIAAAAACAVAAADPGGGAFDDGPSVERPDLAPVAPPDPAPAPATSSDSGAVLVGRRAPPARSIPRGDVTVRVVGPTGVPLPGRDVGVAVRGELADSIVTTDDVGRVVLQNMPWDGTADAILFEASHCSRVGLSCGRATIAGPILELRADSGVRLQVDTVDTETGHPVFGLEKENRIAETAPGIRGRCVEFGSRAPAGYVEWDQAADHLTMSRYARSLFAVYPLRREAYVRAVVAEPDGSTPRIPCVTRVRAAGQLIETAWAEDVGVGVFRLHGIPFFRGEPVTLAVEVADREQDEGVHVLSESATRVDFPARRRADWSGTMPDLPCDDLLAEVVLPPPEPVFSFSSSFRGRGGHRNISCGGCGGRRQVDDGGSLVVVARRRGGGPAAAAHVRLAWDYQGEIRYPMFSADLDADGRVRLSHLEALHYRVYLEEPGLVTTSATAEVVAGEERAVTIAEAEGGEVDVVVVDGEGRGLPFASLEVKTADGPDWIDLDGAVQRIDPFTDHAGRRTLRHVDAGEVPITASWGSRSKKVVVEAIEGRRTEARIVLE